MSTDPRVARVIDWFEALSRDNVATLDEIYASDVRFRDPFNDVHGIAEVKRIYAEMYEHLADCRFEILDAVVDEGGTVLTWNMGFRFQRYRPHAEQTIHGASHLKFDSNGRIVYHRDYWDAAGELYSKLPLIGPVMRYLKRRMA